MAAHRRRASVAASALLPGRRAGRPLAAQHGDHDRPATPSYTAVSTDQSHTCAIRASDGAIACWGISEDGRTFPPEGSFTAIGGGGNYTCAIRTSNGEIECWGVSGYYQQGELIETGQANVPAGRFIAVSAGGMHTCGLRESGAITCWGDNRATPPN